MSRDPSERTLDVICLGRAAVDLYGQQVGGRLEDMVGFRKYLGGSSANLAAGLARLGLRSAMLTRVGNEHMGRFVREALSAEGVDVSQVRTDPDRLTALVMLGIGPAGEVPHIFFRERCADMALCEEDIDESFIASARMLSITGTHLSTAPTRAAVRRAIALARANGTRVTLDIDYRPVLWGLQSPGEGASRYRANAEVTRVLAEFLPWCDLIVGTEEEVAIAGGSEDLLAALRAIRSAGEAWIVLKRGAAGCMLFPPGPIDALAAGIQVAGRPVEVFNSLGAGDAFLSGFLSGWLSGEDPEFCGRLGNACGALVVARHGCTPAMPSRIELDAFLSRDPPPRRPRLDVEISHLHRTTVWKDDPRPLCALAFDHRRQFEELANQTGSPFSRIARFKRLLAEAVLEVSLTGGDDIRIGVILDRVYGEEAAAVLSGRGLWTARPVEVPTSRPLCLAPRNEIGLVLDTWPAGDIVKVLLFYHPDDEIELRLAQEERLSSLYKEIVDLDRRLLLEVICPTEEHAVDDRTLARTLRRFYNLGIRPDWWKLKPPSAAGWEALSSVIHGSDPHCKGVVLLGLDAEESTLLEGFAAARDFPLFRGFAVGRSIFRPAAERWFAGTIDDVTARRDVAGRYLRMIEGWREAGRKPARAAGVAGAG